MTIDIPVKISGKAISEIREIITRKGIPEGYGLRIGIKGAGCSGMGFMLGFDQMKTSDLEYMLEDIRIYIDKKHVMYVLGLEIDFYEGKDEQGFTFINPQAETNTTA